MNDGSDWREAAAARLAVLDAEAAKIDAERRTLRRALGFESAVRSGRRPMSDPTRQVNVMRRMFADGLPHRFGADEARAIGIIPRVAAQCAKNIGAVRVGPATYQLKAQP